MPVSNKGQKTFLHFVGLYFDMSFCSLRASGKQKVWTPATLELRISESSARNAKNHSCFTSRHCRGVKVLVGTPVTCLKGDDEKTWGSSLGKDSNNFSIFQELDFFFKSGWTKEFLAMVGPKHVMGLAIGNELELLHNHVPWQAKCFPPVCLSMKFLPVTCHVCFYTHFSSSHF